MKIQGFILGGALLLGVATVGHAASDYDDTAARADVTQLGKDAGSCFYGNAAPLARLRILTADGGLCLGYDDDSGAYAACGRTFTDWAATDIDIGVQLGKPGGNFVACNKARSDWYNVNTKLGVEIDVFSEMNEINSQSSK